MPEYTVVRVSNGHVICRTTDLAELPDWRSLTAMRQFKQAILYEDGVEVRGSHYVELLGDIKVAQWKGHPSHQTE